MDIRGFFTSLIYIPSVAAIILPVHEFAHVFASYKLGDTFQKQRGRLTLNPPKHLDPFGTLPPILFGFGRVKPAQVDPYFYCNKKGGTIQIAMAGPLINFIVDFLMVISYALFTRFGLLYRNESTYYLFQITGTAASINIGLGVFSLIPIPPLDGSKILTGILKEETYFELMQYEMYLSFIAIFPLMSDALGGPLIHAREAILDVFVKAASMITGPG